jgi:Fur family ferric uptake transcriptional regulator
VLARAGRPLTPAEIFDAASQACVGLGVRTVYRHIRELCRNGEAVGVDYPGQPRRYEAAGGQHHAHFICNRCQKVYDLPGKVPDIAIKAPPGFSVTGQETIFYGECPACAGLAD